MVALALGAVSAAELPFDKKRAVLDELPGADVPVQMHFEGQKLSDLLGAMAAAGTSEVTCEDGVGDVVVAVDWMENQSMKQALVRLAREYDLDYTVPWKKHRRQARRRLTTADPILRQSP